MEYWMDDPVSDRQEKGCVEGRVEDRVEDQTENRVENWAEKAIIEDRAKIAEDSASSFRSEAHEEARRMVDRMVDGRGLTDDEKLKRSEWRRQRQFPKRIIEWRTEKEVDWAIDSIKKQREPNNMSPDGKKLLMLPSSDYFLPIPHIVVSYSVAQTESYWKVTRGQVHEPTKLELEAARQAGTISKIDLANYVYGYVIYFFF